MITKIQKAKSDCFDLILQVRALNFSFNSIFTSPIFFLTGNSTCMKMKNSPLADTVVIKFIEILEEHQRRCNQQKEFKEAEEIKCHIKELKNQERNRRKEVLHCKQILEKLDVENAHKIELDEFYLKWNEKLNDHDLSSRAELSLNESRHTSEIEMKAKTLFASHKLPKPSTELLRLKHLVRTHAKQKK